MKNSYSKKPMMKMTEKVTMKGPKGSKVTVKATKKSGKGKMC
jgi:hypothetical protein